MFDWLRRGLHREPKPGVPAGELPSPDISRAYEDIQAAKEETERERLKRTIAEEEVRQARAAREKVASEEAQAEYEGRVPPRGKTPEEILSRLPEKERKKYKKRVEAGERGRVEAEMEIWESGIPGKKKVMHRVWNSTKQTWEFKEVEVALTPQERLAEARIQKIGGMLVEEEVEAIKQKRRERSLPHRVSRGAIGFGQHMAAVGVLGVAGVARGIQPGRGGPERAARMHAPSLPLDLYRVRPMLGVGVPRARDLTGAGLGHLRSALAPRMRRRE